MKIAEHKCGEEKPVVRDANDIEQSEIIKFQRSMVEKKSPVERLVDALVAKGVISKDDINGLDNA
jgi:polyhydroxyalkanoate synthesis regulator phasin